MNELTFYCRRHPWSDGISLYLKIVDREIHRVSIAKPIELTVVPEGAAFIDMVPPLLDMSVTNAQRLMDELWHCGLRPSEGTGSAGSLAATQKHLDDMRALVFKTKAPGNNQS